MLLAGPSHGFSLFGDSETTRYWSQSNQDNQITVDHSRWDGLLERYIREDNGINLFDYNSVSPQDQDLLSGYLASLQQLRVTGLNSSEQFAYWINLYNALTLRVILDHYPLESIMDISYGLTSSGPWSEELVTVEGRPLSLDAIEHEILRPIFRDNRIHYAVNCASIGCPNLQQNAFTAENIEAMLDTAARQYVNHPRGVSVTGNRLVVSNIYDWYDEDFGDSEREVIKHLLLYADPDLTGRLEDFKSIDDYQYDWSIND